MTLLAPIMMAGAAAVTIPIALHFFYRARYRPLPWAPMKFLKEAVEQTSRRLKFQEWILLALRCLAIILLALALARPSRDSASSAGGGEPIDAVLLLDTSYSMAARDGNKTRFELAKEAAAVVIDTLPDKSSIQIISTSQPKEPLGPVSRYNRDQAKQLLQTIEVTSLSTDLMPGLEAALAAAQTGTSPAKELYVFTDMQKSGFERQQSALQAKCNEIKENDVNLVFVRCGNPERRVSNLAITDVQLLAAIPHTKTRVPFVVKLKNTGRDPITGAKVFLELDGRAVEKDAVQVDKLEPGETVTLTLTGALEDAGPRLVAVYAEGDGLPGDNVLYKVIGVREKVRVLLIAHPFAGQTATDAGDWFVRKALIPFDPVRDEDKIKRYFIETESAAPNEVAPEKLAHKDIVFLLNAAAQPTRYPLQDKSGKPGKPEPRGPNGLSDEFVGRLREFVRAGGGLIIGSGDQLTAASAEVEIEEEKDGKKARRWVAQNGYNRMLGSAGAGLLPMNLGDVRNTTEAALFTPAATSIEDGSPLAPLKPFGDWVARAQLARTFALEEGTAGAKVLLRTTDNKPLVTSRVVGDGEVIFFATALDETWGRMMSDGQLAIPMTTHLLAHLTGRKVPGGTRMAGDVLSYHPAKQFGGFELVKPKPKSGEKVRPRLPLGEARTENNRLIVSTDKALVAGEYALVPSGTTDPAGLTVDSGVAFAVNPDLRETENLDSATDVDVEKALGFKPAIISAGAGTESAVRDRRTRGEFTEWALLVLLLLLIGEAAWAWQCGRAA